MVSLVFLLCLYTQTACIKQQSVTEESNEDFYKMNRISSNQYEINPIELNSLGIKKASGLTYSNHLIHLSDSSKNEIKIFNQHWKLVDTIRSEKIASPSLLAAYEDCLAILDASISHIILFDIQTKKVINVIPLPPIDSNSNYADMEMSDKELLITYHTPAFEDASILRIDRSFLKCKKIQEKFNGFVGITNHQFYFVNSLVPYQEVDQEGFRSGKNSFWILKDSKPKVIGDLIEGSAPGDFLWNEKILIQYTSGWSSIDRYDQNFKYMDSIAVFEQSNIQSLIKGNETKIYLLMPNEQKLFEVKKI